VIENLWAVIDDQEERINELQAWDNACEKKIPDLQAEVEILELIIQVLLKRLNGGCFDDKR
jgi:hypothetical protein